MEILIAVTKNCPHRTLLEHELQNAWLPYKVAYFEEHPELLEKYHVKHSPLLIVDGKVESIETKEILDIINELKIRDKDISKIRTPKRAKNFMVPKGIGSESGLVEVDTTWGSIQPMQAAQNVVTIGEQEVYHHQKMNLSIIDIRKASTTDGVSIPGSKSIPYDELAGRMDELDKTYPNIFFCNGPQCPQSSTAIKNLLNADFPADRILYYRGGMHDWITMGLPVQRL
ncbi:rhodanese-related sulfurtransferase [Gillisia sp. Hel_I_86]|uniref:rhodanese-like domain-containing protein n=1 Tax=Gillisia sp. Hel_I_86 TaxID=1249981 RepID=UPI00119953D5|nr:rhodanese-like domain-containing protein [Gillisia sp. Hel_I_86]TVZ28780.1 rhodanese-related sulfurtransferase [Gillisia sp. Hel_I_86]